MRILLPAILILALVLLWPPAASATPANLYLGSVPVADQSLGEQSRAMPLALAQVLSKLTGLLDFGDIPDLQAVLQDARSLAITFYYRNAEVILADGSKLDELRLVADFSRPAVDELLRRLQLPIWKPERRPLTVWLIIDDGVSRKIMPIEFDYVWAVLVNAAEARGMPLTRPQADEEGEYAVDPQLLWGGYTEELGESGPVDALIIAARREGPEWNVRMNLDYAGARWTWRHRDIDIQAALVAGIDQSIDEIVKANSIAASDQGHWNIDITVTGLNTAADYRRCLSYLQGLSLIERVRVAKAAPGRIQFALSLNALPEYLQGALDSDGVLAVSSAQGQYMLQP